MNKKNRQPAADQCRPQGKALEYNRTDADRHEAILSTLRRTSLCGEAPRFIRWEMVRQRMHLHIELIEIERRARWKC